MAWRAEILSRHATPALEDCLRRDIYRDSRMGSPWPGGYPRTWRAPAVGRAGCHTVYNRLPCVGGVQLVHIVGWFGGLSARIQGCVPGDAAVSAAPKPAIRTRQAALSHVCRQAAPGKGNCSCRGRTLSRCRLRSSVDCCRRHPGGARQRGRVAVLGNPFCLRCSCGALRHRRAPDDSGMDQSNSQLDSVRRIAPQRASTVPGHTRDGVSPQASWRTHRRRSDLGKLLCVVLDVPQYCRTASLVVVRRIAGVRSRHDRSCRGRGAWRFGHVRGRGDARSVSAWLRAFGRGNPGRCVPSGQSRAIGRGCSCDGSARRGKSSGL